MVWVVAGDKDKFRGCVAMAGAGDLDTLSKNQRVSYV
jgi:hypothetical protein